MISLRDRAVNILFTHATFDFHGTLNYKFMLFFGLTTTPLVYCSECCFITVFCVMVL